MQERIKKAYAETHKALEILYGKRKRTLFFQKVMWGLTGIYFLFMILLLIVPYLGANQITGWKELALVKTMQENPYGSIYPVLGVMVLIYPTTLLFARAFQKFVLKEQQTMAVMVKTLFPEVEFTQGAIAPTREVVKSKLFAWIKEDTPIYSYGQLRNLTEEVQVNIADIGLIEHNVTNRFLSTLMHIPLLNMFAVLYQSVFKNIVTGNLADNTSYSFRGMFCWMYFKKKLNGHTVVLPKSQLVELDRLSSFNFREEQQILLEDPRFTQSFTVYSTDQVEARYVLSAALMERIVTLKEKFDRPVFLSFQDKQLYLAVKNENGLFSFPSRKAESLSVVEELAIEIDTALNIPKQLFQ